MDTKQKMDLYGANTYKRFNVTIKSGKGAVAVDENGKEYIDLGSGIAVNPFGYSDEVTANAVYAQMSELTNTSNLYYTSPQADLAEWLCTHTGMKKAFFSNSGAEANECAIKTARKYSSDKYGQGEKRSTIITLNNSFHGRTLATLKATGQPEMHVSFGPFPEGFQYVNANDTPAMLEALSSGSVCAVMMEMIQGEGGVLPLEKDFVMQTVREAAARDILVIADEVQAGNGRCGTLYAYEAYGIQPDIFTTAKGLGGGLPIGATLLGEKLADTLTPGSHGSTFGGNPICCAAALSVVHRLDEALLSEVREKGEYIRSELIGAPGVENVTGMGLFIGVKTTRDAQACVEAMIDKGVLALTAHGRIRFLPPLNIPMDLLKKAIAIAKEVFAEIYAVQKS